MQALVKDGCSRQPGVYRQVRSWHSVGGGGAAVDWDPWPRRTCGWRAAAALQALGMAAAGKRKAQCGLGKHGVASSNLFCQ